MAHICYACGNKCYCSGDIDNEIISITPPNCTSCDCINELDFSIPVVKAPCSCCKKEDELVEIFMEGEPQGHFCYECCEKEGYCWSCGEFSSGNSSFDFSKMGAYCESCQEQISDSCDY